MANKKPTDYFDPALAELLGGKISTVHPGFDQKSFCRKTTIGLSGKTLMQRVEWMADQMKDHLPEKYPNAVEILSQILGPENPKETGMFTEYYWLMPVAKFVEKYGLDHYDISIRAIGEITRRNTGEYAIRPYIRSEPEQTLYHMEQWALSGNFHLRRLASEGLRPKLPWATKLDLFVDEPEPVFGILNHLKADPVLFVRKSVANHLTDYLKVNPPAATELIDRWGRSDDKHTRWILKRATRKFSAIDL